MRRILSWLLLLGGVVLLFAGARDVLFSYWGQRAAAADWAVDTSPETDASRATPDFGPALARMSIPRLEASWLVFEGTGRKQLRLGPGHLQGTALPGTTGNCIIAGHRDTHFRVLKDVRKGDEIVIETREGEFVYRVTGISVISPKNTAPLKPATRAVMNLITCYPFYYVGPAPKRFVVQAELAQAS